MRSGADRPRAIGRRMSGGEACANRGAVHRFHHGMDDGLRVHGHVDAFGGTLNKRDASMTLRPLFISVEELMVTTGPMFHVG